MLTAVVLDPRSGRFLVESPVAGNLVSVVPSPASDRVAALAYRDDTSAAEIFLSEEGGLGWRPVATHRLKGDTLESWLPAISWSPDRRYLVVPQSAKDTGEVVENYLRLFDATTGTSRIVAAGDPSPAIRWTSDSRGFYFSRLRSGAHVGGIYRVDLGSTDVIPIVTDDDFYLLDLSHRFIQTMPSPFGAVCRLPPNPDEPEPTRILPVRGVVPVCECRQLSVIRFQLLDQRRQHALYQQLEARQASRSLWS